VSLWRTFFTVFATVFVAEIGDKTQLATLSLAAGGNSKLAVFAGSALALCATSAIAVLAGEGISRFISPIWMKRIAGGVFIILGLLFIFVRSDL